MSSLVEEIREHDKYSSEYEALSEKANREITIFVAALRQLYAGRTAAIEANGRFSICFMKWGGSREIYFLDTRDRKVVPWYRGGRQMRLRICDLAPDLLLMLGG
jgi:hypothetical protein